MIRQVPTRQTGLRGIMSGKPFMDGFREAGNGQPPRYDAYRLDANDQWNYERGRLFAHIYKGPLKESRKIYYPALATMAEAIRSRTIL